MYAPPKFPLPMFPTAKGNTVTKESVVASVEAMLGLINSPVRDEDGVIIYG